MHAPRNLKLIVKSDCLMVANELQQIENSFFALGNLMHNMKEIIVSFLVYNGGLYNLGVCSDFQIVRIKIF